MSAELKPCPFDCGSRIAPVAIEDEGVWSVVHVCGAYGPTFSRVRAHAVEAWNRRAPAQDAASAAESFYDAELAKARTPIRSTKS